MKYIHYGADKFDKSLVKPVKNAEWGNTKPKSGGMWASPIDAEWGWKEWCSSNDFRVNSLNKSFTFKIKDDARVLHLMSVNDVRKLPEHKCQFNSLWYTPDFEKAAEKYDAIQLHLSEQPRCNYEEDLYFLLYGWDCDSILIMNPDVIVL